ncbi:MAG: hypothetical protein A3K83_03705 [Omnitrophica WOR_2 bacterium RBG_13_44_8b]|nr:MAG: hypothetical protein A3K83_03705 [Omnitrophica WOR_2 bacterium RBG_13_44_8b]
MKRKIFVTAFLSLLILTGCSRLETDVQFARRVFNSMCKGNRSVQNSIDWENFKSMGLDVGKAYSSIVAEKDRADYRKVFFYNLAYTFRASGGNLSIFINWRVLSQDAETVVIGTDSSINGKTLKITLSFKNGKRKIAGIDWQQ